MLNGKKIVVVMPAYNAEKTLEKTYNEIYKDIVDEIILTDDKSNDNTKDLAKDLLSVASERFDFYADVIDKEYIGAFVEYLKSSECVDKLDYNLLFDIVDRIFINANGIISIKFVNDAVLCYEEGEFKNVAC